MYIGDDKGDKTDDGNQDCLNLANFGDKEENFHDALLTDEEMEVGEKIELNFWWSDHISKFGTETDWGPLACCKGKR